MHCSSYYTVPLIRRSILIQPPNPLCISAIAYVHHPPWVRRSFGFLILVVLGLLADTEAAAQSPVKPAKAAAYSILVPGLGHKYTNEGRWNRSAAFYTITDAILVAGLVTSEWQRRHLVQSYQTWAASYAGVSNAGKDRRFYITIGNHLSSNDYREVQLRNRRVDLISYVDDPAFQWTWQNIQDLQRYRDLRRSSENWAQQRSGLIAALVANRVVAAVSALITARRKRESRLHIAVIPGPVVQVAFTM